MKLSDAIMLGSTQLRFEPKYWMCEDGGCLLGLGGYAVGVRYETDENKRDVATMDEIGKITAIWPWINNSVEVPQFIRKLPPYEDIYPFAYLSNMGYLTNRRTYQAKALISVMAVHVKLGNLTMEQVVDWIRSVEPQEAEPTPQEAVEIFCDSLVKQ
jgi:hypothetical protein